MSRLIQAQRTGRRFDKRDRVAVQIMVGVLRARSTVRPDFEGLSVDLRPEHKEWILQLWSAATGKGGDAKSLPVPERHEALADGMRGALRLADQYAAVDQYGPTMRAELRDALQSVRADLHAAASTPQRLSGLLGFVPDILDIAAEKKPARTGSPLSSQPAELRELVYLSFPSRRAPKEPETWFHDLTERQRRAFVDLYNALSGKDLFRFVHTIHHLDDGEPHFWGAEQEGNTVSLKVVGDTEGLNKRLGDPMQDAVVLDSPFMSMMHRGQKSYRERSTGSGLHISVGPGKFWDVHLDAHPPLRANGTESDAEIANRFMLHGLQELFPNMPRAALAFLLEKVHIPPEIAAKIANHALPAIRFLPATDSPLWRSNNHGQIDALDIKYVRQEGRELTAAVGISGRF